MPDITEKSLVRITIGLGDEKGIDDFDPPLTEAERWWYKTLKKNMEEFKKANPGVKPIWEIPFSYD